MRYGRYQNHKRTVEEVLEQIRALPNLPGRAVPVEVRDEGPTSEDTPFLTVRFGNDHGPRFTLITEKHGMEWENVAGMLVTIEQLLTGKVIDLDRFCVVAVPLPNPFGYRNGCRHNANGVDLNRQLRQDWDTFRGWTDEVVEPWTFDFKGTARGTEPEAQIEARLRAEPNLIAFIDAHGMAGEPILGGTGPDPAVLKTCCDRIADNLKNRYLVRYLDSTAPKQLTLQPEQGWAMEKVPGLPYYSLWYENLCQLPDVHATVMQTDMAAEVNLGLVRGIAESLD